MRYTLLLLLSLLLGSLLQAQAVTVTEATRQTWAGGQCCSQGINYMISLQPDAKTRSFKLDTLWIGDVAFIPDSETRQAGLVQCAFDSLSGTYRIYAGQSWNDHGLDIEMPPVTPKIKHPRYAGEALVVYHINGRKRRLPIKQMTELEPLAYP